MSHTSRISSDKPADKKDDLQCVINLNDEIKGNTITGFVQINATGQLIIQTAIIELHGIAKCEWKLDCTLIKFPNYYKQGSTFRGLQQFYYSRHTLCGGEISHKHRANEVYPFTCGWPTRLPATWKGEYGEIKYVGRVTIKTSVYTHVHLQEIGVSPNRDLSIEPHLLFESRQDVTRHFNYSSQSGSVSLSIWLPISGIAAGQSLPLVCTIVNTSDLHFGGLVFVLTKIDIYRSDTPTKAVKTVREDICRVARMVHVHKGKYNYYAVLQTNEDLLPTDQFYTCKVCQRIYEVWASLQGSFPRYKIYGYPNIDTPGIPLIIGTKPIKHYDADAITINVLNRLYTPKTVGLVETLPRDEEVEELLNAAEEELDEKTMRNLTRQLKDNERAIQKIAEDSNSETEIPTEK